MAPNFFQLIFEGVIVIRCFYFQLGVVSWQLYGKENLSSSGGYPALFRMKHFGAALDADFSHTVLLTEVSY